MNTLVVGCGSMGSRRARILVSLGHTVFVGDTDAARSDALAKEVGARAVHWDCWVGGEYEIGAPLVAFISTWPENHIALAREAVRVGAHVFIEKPLALSEDGLDELEREAEANKVKVMVGCNWRFHPSIVATTASASALSPMLLAFGVPSFLGDAQSGGLLLDVGSHSLDLARHLLGGIVEIVRFDNANGKYMEFRASHLGGTVSDHQLIRTVLEQTAWRRLQWTDDRNALELPPDPIMYEHETAHFLRAIETGAPHMNPLSEARDTLRYLLAMQST